MTEVFYFETTFICRSWCPIKASLVNHSNSLEADVKLGRNNKGVRAEAYSIDPIDVTRPILKLNNVKMPLDWVDWDRAILLVK